MIGMIYGLIVLFATTIGAISGLGGGVIIKPLFDLVNIHSAQVINFYSSLAVFTMAVVSIFKQLHQKVKIDIRPVLFLSVGSIFGGLLGEQLFQWVQREVSFPISSIQSLLLCIVLVLILIYSSNRNRIKTFHLKHPLLIAVIGVILGSLSVFLGIGGGPLNVAVFTFFFSYSMKEATVLSIITIFFSQSAKLTNVVLFGRVALNSEDLSFIPWILVAAVIGGYIGSIQNKKLEEEQILKIHDWVIGSLILLSLVNFFQG